MGQIWTHDPYTTKDEINFITGLGRKKWSLSKMSRGLLLANYLQAAEKRVYWTSIDSFKCIHYALECLKTWGKNEKSKNN